MGVKNNIYKLGLFGLLAIILSSCGGYNKLLKSKDNELKYRMAIEYFEAGKYQRTIQLLGDVMHIFSGTTKDDSVAYYMGTSFYKSADFDTSGMLFDEFRQTYTASPFLEDVEYMYAMGFYYMSPVPNRDQTTTNQALIAMDEYLERYPNSVKKDDVVGYIDELMQKLHDKAFINAKSYYTTRRYKAAAVALKNALNKYPDSSHREEIMYLTVKSNYLLASNSYESLMRDRFLDMMDSYYSFVSEFPESKYLGEVDKMQDEAKKYIATFQDGTTIIKTIEEEKSLNLEELTQ